MNQSRVTKTNPIFTFLIYFVILVVTASCLLPILNLLALSFSDSQAIIENKVTIFPVDFTLKAYKFVMGNEEFWRSCLVSLERVLLGVPLNVILTILVAYPLSKDEHAFPQRKRYVRLMLFVMLFNGGLMPTYFMVAKTGLIDTIWSLVIPGAVPVMSCILMLNFFRGIPKEIEESAMLDGASPLQVLVKIYLPLSKPSIATVTLFSLIWHWNSWFDVNLYSKNGTWDNLQIILYRLLNQMNAITQLTEQHQISEKMRTVQPLTMRAAITVVVTAPIIMIYPFFQKYFVSGITMGAVKG